MRTSEKPGSLGNLALTVVMLPLAALVAFPFYYIVVTTLKTSEEIQSNPLGLPQSVTFANYVKVLSDPLIPVAFANTVYVTVASVALMVLVGSLAAFAITLKRTWFNRVVAVALLAGFLVPYQTTLLPLYKMIAGVGLVDTLTGLIAIYSAGAVFCYFIIVGYMRTLPPELFEAARIDGARPFRMYFSIALPLVRPVLVTVGVFQVMAVWNDYVSPTIYLSSPDKTTLVLLASRAVAQFTIDWPMFMTVTVVVLIPMLVLFLVAQKYIVSGLVAGSLKG
ncbi:MULTISPECIES: carbohydrate ABC transporter permease [unclassified Microbacterium]|uniref:carbohydrate ABC transporter permease n=1 Tax=unclassified Microbacterium TaxID=2609290 RepID=UPI00301B1A32